MENILMKELVEKLNNATKAYDQGKPYISDKEWDKIYFHLVELEKELGYSLPDSPTQKIIYQAPVLELNKVNHNHRMLSLAKTKSIDEVNAFLNNREAVITEANGTQRIAVWQQTNQFINS